MEWVIVCNPKYYNIESAFKNMNFIDWHQNIKADIDDQVFIYVGKPVGAILYRCIVRKIELTADQITDDHEYNLEIDSVPKTDKYMRLELIESYSHDRLTRKELLMNGLKTIQGPSKVSDELHNFIQFRTISKLDRMPIENRTLSLQLTKFNVIVHDDEPELLSKVHKFVEDFDIKKLQRMAKEEYVYGNGKKDTFCYRITHELEGWGSIKRGTSSKYGFFYGAFGEDTVKKYRATKAFGNTNTVTDTEAAFDKVKYSICELISAGSRSDFQAITDNPLSTMFKGKILCVYFPEKYMNIYSEDHVDYYMDILGISHNSSDSVMENGKKIIEWKNSNPICHDWTNHEFSKFIYRIIGYPADRERVKKEKNNIERIMDTKLVSELNEDGLEGENGYNPVPEARKEPENIGEYYSYPRDAKIAANALKRANYLCAVNKNHPSFIRRSNNQNYTEPHHLIPLAFQDKFTYSLDVEANIISLCSNCHNEIHYGKHPEIIIKKLYQERVDELRAAGIFITLENLLQCYK